MAFILGKRIAKVVGISMECDKMIEDYDHIITIHDNCRCSKPAHLKNQAIATLATHEFRCSSKFYNLTKVGDEIY